MTGIWRWFSLASVCVASLALAQEPVPTVARDGSIEQVLVNPHGEPDGLLLRDGTLVRFPPHTVEDASVLRIGAQVHAEGEAATSPSGVTLFDARVSVAARNVVADRAPPAGRRPSEAPIRALTASGRVRITLTNPDGVIDGFVLDDGTVVHAGPRARLSRLGVAPGVQVTVTGQGGNYPQGKSLHAETLRVGEAAVVRLRGPREAAPPPAP